MRETRCGTFELWSLPRSAASPADACGLPGAYGRRHNLCHGAIDPADGCLARGAGVQLHLAAVRCTDDRPHTGPKRLAAAMRQSRLLRRQV